MWKRIRDGNLTPKSNDAYISASPPSTHSKDTYKLWNLRTGKEMFRRNVYFNERSFPARLDAKINRPLMPAGQADNTDKGEDLIGEEFADEGETFTVVGTDYKSNQFSVIIYSEY